MRWFRRTSPADWSFPDEWRAIIERRFGEWLDLTGEERARLEYLTALLLDDVRWEAARDFDLNDDIRVTIAVHAAYLVLALDDDDAYANIATIIVHPRPITLHGERAGPISGTATREPLDVLGEAHYDGPVLVAWNSVVADTRHPTRARNVVYHEFAHKLDMADGVVNGTPPMSSEELMRRWVAVCTAEYHALRAGTDEGFLDDYGATDPGEFFAVATETFFTIPEEMVDAKPELYAVLRDFSRQDPAARRHSSQRK